ncbi:unnamed protein product [Cunninghamella echinulata]
METSQILYKEASDLLNNGQTKDAYNKFISTVELSTQQLHNVKFVHQTLVTTPNDYYQLLETIRSSITQLESILSQTTYMNGKLPPPVPPKPPLRVISKPSISSKRSVPPPLAIFTTDFAFRQKQTPSLPIISNNNEEKIEDDDDDDDDDEEEEDEEDILTSATTLDTPSSINKPSLPPRPKNPSHTNYTNTSPLSPLSASTITSSTCLETIHIDPYDLVPVQTNTGESMALPILPTCTTDFYIPKIPASPLLGLHKELQQQLDVLLQQQQQEKKNDQQQQQIANIRKALTNIRTIYMSAMTAPNIMEFSPELIAYQLTLIESSIFRAIPPEALQQHRSVSKIPHPNIVASTDFFNYLTRSIEHSILLPQEASHRAQVVHRWIKIASLCLTLHNYQTLKAIVSALGTPPIQRLKRTWECIPKKRIHKLEMLTSLMSETDNYSKYREHIRTLIPHCQYHHRSPKLSMVPFLGVLIHDMTYILTVNKSSSSSSLEDDMRKQDILDWMKTFQSTPAYPFRPPTPFMKKKNGFFSKQNYSPSGIISSTTKSINLQQYQQLLTSSKSISLPSSPITPPMEDSMLSDIEQDHQYNIPIEQQRITHYLLMRTWVNEKIIDELSSLREPLSNRKSLPSSASIQRANSYHSHFSQSTITNNHHHHDSMLSTTSSSESNSSSMIQFEDSPRTPTLFSFEESQISSPSSSKRSFWPFRKSHDLTRVNSTPIPYASTMTMTKSTTTTEMSLTSLDNGVDHVKKNVVLNRNLNLSHQRSASVNGPLIC